MNFTKGKKCDKIIRTEVKTSGIRKAQKKNQLYDYDNL